MAYRRLRPGDGLEAISATAYNAMLDMLEGGSSHSTSPLSETAGGGPFNAVLAKNNTGNALPAFGIVRLAQPLFLPSDVLANFQRRYAYSALKPTGPSNFAVMLSKAGAGDLKHASIAGVAPVTIDVQDEDHDRAAPINNDSQKLASGFAGTAEILWKESGTGLKQAVIRWPILPQRRMLGTTSAVITPGNSGSVNVKKSGNVTLGSVTAHLTYMHGNQQISANREVLVEYFPEHEKWIIVGAECED